MLDRRHAFRTPIDIFFNKFLDGHPYLCRSVDLSRGGLLAVTFSEPRSARGSFPLELRLPGDEADSLWIWARGVWRQGARQAIEFVGLDAGDRERLDRYLVS